MEQYLNQAPCLYFCTSDDGKLVEVNERLCTELGYSREELTEEKADIFFTMPTKIFQQTHFFPLLKIQGHAKEIYITLKKNNGEEVPVLINAERKCIEGRNLNLYTGMVVHNRKKFEEELIAAKRTAETALNENTALIEAKKELQQHSEELDQKIFVINKQNEELKQFNRVVTHDVQEPLRKLFVFSNMVLENNGREDQKNLMNKIRRVCDQMKDILSGLQQYIWLTEASVKPTTISLNKIILIVQQELKKEYPGVELIVEMEGIQTLLADWEQMHLLFYQLLSNAIKFRKKENHAFVKILASTLQVNQFRNIEGKYKYIDHLRIEIKDEGMGFNPEFNAKAFELFRKLHSSSGRGVGLSLCKKIVDNHQGSINIDSTEGEGTTVILLFPLNNLAPKEKSNSMSQQAQSKL